MARREKVKELYDCQSDFKLYLDKYCAASGYTVSEATDHALVWEVANYYAGKDREVCVRKTLQNCSGDLGNGIPI